VSFDVCVFLQSGRGRWLSWVDRAVRSREGASSKETEGRKERDRRELTCVHIFSRFPEPRDVNEFLRSQFRSLLLLLVLDRDLVREGVDGEGGKETRRMYEGVVAFEVEGGVSRCAASSPSWVLRVRGSLS